MKLCRTSMLAFIFVVYTIQAVLLKADGEDDDDEPEEEEEVVSIEVIKPASPTICCQSICSAIAYLHEDCLSLLIASGDGAEQQHRIEQVKKILAVIKKSRKKDYKEKAGMLERVLACFATGNKKQAVA